MFISLRRTLKKIFREFLVYNHSSLEYRAKLLTLIISSNNEISECEKQKLKEIAHSIYKDDHDRAALLVDTVIEYHSKIVTENGLNFEHLIRQVENETKTVKRFPKKIDMALLAKLHECAEEEDEEDFLFQERILEFLQNLKDEYGEKNNGVG